MAENPRRYTAEEMRAEAAAVGIIGFRDAYAMLTQAAATEEERGWRPIETAPRDGTLVLALFPDRDWVESVRFQPEGGYAFGCDGDEAVSRPTHWMPLPPAPEAP